MATTTASLSADRLASPSDPPFASTSLSASPTSTSTSPPTHDRPRRRSSKKTAEDEVLRDQIRKLRESYAPAWGAIPSPRPRDLKGKGKAKAAEQEPDKERRRRSGGGTGEEGERGSRITVVEAPFSPPRPSSSHPHNHLLGRPSPTPRSPSSSSAESGSSTSSKSRTGGRCPACGSELRPASAEGSAVLRTPLFEESDEEDDHDRVTTSPTTLQDDSALDDTDPDPCSSPSASDFTSPADSAASSMSPSPAGRRLLARRASSFDFSPKHLSPLSAPFRRPPGSTSTPAPSTPGGDSAFSISASASGSGSPSGSAWSSMGWSSPPTTPPSFSISGRKPSLTSVPEVAWAAGGQGEGGSERRKAERKVLLREAQAWPIFARPFSPSTSPSPLSPVSPSGTKCDSCAWAGGRKPVLRRASSASRLGAGPVPLKKAEEDPLLSSSPSTYDSLSSASPSPSSKLRASASVVDSRSTASVVSPLVTGIPVGTERPAAGGKKESLLTKSLKSLGGRLPNLQWAPASSPSLPSSSSSPGPWFAPLPPTATVTSAPLFDVRGAGGWWGVAGADGIVGGEAVLPGGSSRAWEDGAGDPEMEWSSMMVQLQTFSAPPSASNPPTTPQTARRSPAPQPSTSASKSSPPSNKIRRRSKGSLRSGSSSKVLATSPPRPASPLAGRISPGVRSIPGTVGERMPPPSSPSSSHFEQQQPTRRLLSNPYHLLQLTLERKIGGPLRQRAFKVVVVLPDTSREREVWVSVADGSQMRMREGAESQATGKGRRRSRLRQEVVFD